MIPLAGSDALAGGAFPRTRGDDPTPEDEPKAARTFSPHPRG